MTRERVGAALGPNGARVPTVQKYTPASVIISLKNSIAIQDKILPYSAK